MSTDQPGALQGRRVLELADDTGSYCGKLLADMGAEVIKIEPPGGDAGRNVPPFLHDRLGPLRSLSFLAMNTNKRSVTLDLERSADVEALRGLARSADVIIETFPPGHLDALSLGYTALSSNNPSLVFTSITGFGQSGPRSQWRSSDLVACALGGSLVVTGDATDPPVSLAGAQACRMASAFAAAASLIALRYAHRGGRGQHIDISVQEAVVAFSHICGVGKWLEDGIVPHRMGSSLFASVPSGAYPCRDGLIYLMINRPHHWQVLARWIHEATGNPAVLAPLFEGPSSRRLPHRDLLDVYIRELTSRHTVDEMYHEGQQRHLAITPVNDAGAVLHDPHLAARGFFVEACGPGGEPLRYPGAPYRHSETPWRLRCTAPVAGEHDKEVLGGDSGMPPHPRNTPHNGRQSDGKRASQPPATRSSQAPGALADLRVVEFTAGMAGPWIGRFMAWCGAEVIKVESRDHPDVTRLYVPPRQPELGIQPQLSPWFTDWNAGKRFVALDLTRPGAVDLARRLVATADVVVENYASGVLDKLGLGYARLRRDNPPLVMLSSSGYGATGPYRSYVTWGPNIEALSALATLSGFEGRKCTVTQFAYPDAVSAVHGLVAVLCALEYRARTGCGQHIDLSQYEATLAVIGDVLLEVCAHERLPKRAGNRSAHAAPQGCYPCRGEDRWCAITIPDDETWKRFCTTLGRTDWRDDPDLATAGGRRQAAVAVDAGIEAWTRSRADTEAMAELQTAGVPAGAVQNVEDLYRHDPHLAARGFFETIPHAKKGTVVATGIPLGLTGTPGRSTHAGAPLGRDTEYVFSTLLGLTAREIAACITAGEIQTAG